MKDIDFESLNAPKFTFSPKKVRENMFFELIIGAFKRNACIQPDKAFGVIKTLWSARTKSFSILKCLKRLNAPFFDRHEKAYTESKKSKISFGSTMKFLDIVCHLSPI